MAKGKKKKKDKKGSSAGASTGATLKSLSQNPLVADVVAAALVATAAALKDSDRARRLATTAEEELEKLAKKSADRGSALWQLALDVGRKAMDSFAAEAAPAKAKTASKRPKPNRSAKPKAAARAAKKPAKRSARKG